MKKIVKIIILVILILFLLSRVYYFVVIHKVYDAIKDFQDEKNRYYSVIITNSSKNIAKREILRKDDILKYDIEKDNINVYCEFKDFKLNKEYFIDLQSRNFSESELLTSQENFLINLPNLILSIYSNDKFTINEFLKIKYVIPIEYNHQKCYKIATNKQELIVNKDTYLPIYSCIKFMNSTDNSSDITEYIYEFKVGEVTQEDIALPDLTGYTNMSEK